MLTKVVWNSQLLSGYVPSKDTMHVGKYDNRNEDEKWLTLLHETGHIVDNDSGLSKRRSASENLEQGYPKHVILEEARAWKHAVHWYKTYTGQPLSKGLKEFIKDAYTGYLENQR